MATNLSSLSSLTDRHLGSKGNACRDTVSSLESTSSFTLPFMQQQEEILETSRGSMAAINPQSSRLSFNSSLEQMTINKLQFHSLGQLYGRDTEIELLKESFERSKTSRQLVIISGAAGSGKSALAREIQKNVRRDAGFYITGKFDLQQRDEPYAGIATACQELCEDIQSYKEKQGYNKWTFSYQDMKAKLAEELGADTQVLTTVMPHLLQIVGDEFLDASTPSTGNLKAKHRFDSSFRRFVQVICSFGPLVLTLDDLQWADLASLDLMETLITDLKNPSLMIIGSYRDDEVDDSHPLSKTIRDLEQVASDNFGITKISVGNLEVLHVNAMLVDLLTSYEDKTLDLAELVHKKTLGNIFYVIQYLRLLNDNDLLIYNIGVNQWTWKLADIIAHSLATDNVVDLMKERLKNLPPGILDIIPSIACLGSKFHFPIFQLVVEHFSEKILGTEENTNDVYSPPEFLKLCEDEGLIVDCGRGSFKWEHDKIQEAALLLVAEEELPSLQFQVGEILLAELSTEEAEEALFVVANLLNQDTDSIKPKDPRRVEIAKLNLRAGKNAICSSAFEPAGNYLTKGIELLPDDHWESHYELSLELYSMAAEVKCCVGDFELMRRYCGEVLGLANHPLIDKRRAYNALLHSIAAQGRFHEVQDLTVNLLAKLGCHFSKYGKTLCTLAGAIRAKLMCKRTIARIKQLPVIKDESKKWIMSLLDNLTTYTYQNDPVLLPLVLLKSLHYTVRYGLTEDAPAVLALIGLMFAGCLGDFSGAKAFGEQALALADTHRAVQSRTFFLLFQFVMHWQIPVEMCKKRLLLGYTVGMKVGDIESASWSITMYLEMTFHTGGSLDSLINDFQVYSRQMQEMNQHKILTYLKSLWQLAINVNSTSSTAYVLDERDLINRLDATKDVNLKQHSDRFRLFSAFWLGEYEIVLKIMQETGTDKGRYEKTNPGLFGLGPLYFHCALSCISMARMRKQNKYKKIALFFAKKIKGWVKKGNPNVRHYKSLVDAELADLAGDSHLAIKHYEAAILLAGRRGFTNDEALAHERFGEHALQLGDSNDALYHFKRAIELYQEWGAHAKVVQLRSAHGGLPLAPPIKKNFSTGDEMTKEESTRLTV